MNMDTVSKWMAAAALLMLALLCWRSPPFGNGRNERKEFMDECQDDGLKRYQCEAMWRGGLSMLIIPAVRNGLN
jgi:hypothetical protein